MSIKSDTNPTEFAGKGVEKLLGELELAIMRIAWTRATFTVRDMLDVLSATRPLAYTTVMTIMGRLADKGLLTTEKQGKTYQYRATQTPEAFEAQAVGRVVQALLTDFGGELAISQFIEQLSAVDPDQLQQLAEMVKLAQEEENGA